MPLDDLAPRPVGECSVIVPASVVTCEDPRDPHSYQWNPIPGAYEVVAVPSYQLGVKGPRFGVGTMVRPQVQLGPPVTLASHPDQDAYLIADQDLEEWTDGDGRGPAAGPDAW